MEWCRDAAAPDEVRYTVTVLLAYLETDDCVIAARSLATEETLDLENFAITRGFGLDEYRPPRSKLIPRRSSSAVSWMRGQAAYSATQRCTFTWQRPGALWPPRLTVGTTSHDERSSTSEVLVPGSTDFIFTLPDEA